MKYLGKQVNGRDTRNNFIRSMDIDRNRDPDEALAAYSDAWFSSTRKQYLNEALKLIRAGSLFWPRKAFTDMLDEILADAPEDQAKRTALDVDLLKSRYVIWSSKRAARPISDEDMVKYVKEFEAGHKYACPDTFRSCWMNTGAYITLCYGVKYEGLSLPGCSTPEECLAMLKRCAMEVIAEMDHDVDDRMFRLCHAVHLSRLEAAERAASVCTEE